MGSLQYLNANVFSQALAVITRRQVNMIRNEVIEKVVNTTLPENIKQDIINSLTERYLINIEKSEVSIGDSKIGGFPHLPKEYSYPQEETFYYEFVAQINLSELVENNIPHFPTKGILYFFIDDDFNVGNVNSKVIFIDTENSNLEIKTPPQNKRSRCESFDGRTEHTELRLKFLKGLTIDQHLIDYIVNEYLIKQDVKIADFDIEDFYTRDQICGFPATWRISNSEWWAYLTKMRFGSLYYLTLDYQLENLKKQNINFKVWVNNKVDELITKQKDILVKHDRNAYIYSYWEKELEDLEFTKQNLNDFTDDLANHKLNSKNWRQILSISSVYDAKVRFGDGRMEFFINVDDLKNHDFSNIYCHIYG